MLLLARLAFLALLIPAAIAQQPDQAEAPRTQPPGFQRISTQWFHIALPESWRRLSANEEFELRDRLPVSLRHISPGQHAYGDVDRWRAEGYDGRCFIAIVQEMAKPIDEAQLETIVTHWREWRDPGGAHREIIDSGISEVGRTEHRVMWIDFRIVGDGALPPVRARDLYTSTSGRTLALSFQTWEDDWSSAESDLEKVVDSLAFARPPREPESVTDRLLWAAFIGGLVVMLLFLIRRLRGAVRSSP